jgi:hypothetical protein
MMDKLKKQRAPVRSLITRTVREVESELGKEDPNHLVLQEKRRKLEIYQQQVNDLDKKVQDAMIDDDVDDDDLEAECGTADEYLERIVRCVVTIEEKLKIVKDEPSSGDQDGSGAADKQRSFKLPKIEIRKFDGDLKNWLGFWAQFQKINEDKTIHDADKFQYLIQATTEGSRARKVVEKYPQTAANYPLALNALKDRFGDESLLAEVYVRELLNVVLKSRERSASLATMYDELEAQLKALESLGVTTEQGAVFLYPMVESSLPVETIKIWQRSQLSGYGEDFNTKKPDERLRSLMDFLRHEVKGEERLAYVTKGVSSKDSNAQKKQQNKDKVRSQDDDYPAVAGLFIGDKTGCVFCDKPHDAKDCWAAQNMTLEAKNNLIREKRRCYCCLRSGHMSKVCKSNVKCLMCQKKHITLLCPSLPCHQKKKEPDKKTETSPVEKEPVVLTTQLSCSSEVILKTLVVKISGERGSKKIRAILDDGSQRSYISRKVADEIGLQLIGEEKVTHILFGGVQTEVQKYRRMQADLCNLTGKGKCTIEVLDKDKICGNIPRVTSGPWMSRLKDMGVYISDMGDGCPPVDLLIGAKELAKIVTGQMKLVQEGLVAMETVLGWTLMGTSPNMDATRDVAQSNAMIVTSMQVTDASVEQLWSLEAIGIRDPIESSSKEEKEDKARMHFLKTVSRSEDGRYTVSLPWVDGPQRIPNNREVAEKRLQSATRKLMEMDLYKEYEDIFIGWLKEGIVEEVMEEGEPNGAHYLPHRAVLKPQSATTPIMPVFDASCKTGRNPSLNDCLEKGPNLLDLIPSILLRFREGKIGVISDIRKAFLMIDVQEKDRDYLRFLWWEDPIKKIFRVFRHKRVVLGVTCSPFLLGAVIEYHLNQAVDEEKESAEKFRKSLYVDNCVTSVDTTEEYEEFRDAATELMAKAKMELRLWERSSGETTGVGSLISGECGLGVGRGDCKYQELLTSVLGLKWHKGEDWLQCQIEPMEKVEKVTKRVVLSIAQKIYDPLGILSPVLLCPKKLLQEGWDEELTDEIKSRFGDWCSELHHLKKMKIPRNVTGLVQDRKTWQLHTFCDASKDAYAAIVFLRTEDQGEVSVQLLQAKARVAPLKKATIPRLELMGCTIAARLADSVKKAMDLKGVPTYYWSDSSTVLAWIRRNDEWGNVT